MENKGKCNYCENEYQKRGMTRHLKSCKARKEFFETEHMKSTINRYGYFTIKVENRWDDRFWMYVMVREDATLELLDDFFRGIWLECCGHLSQFTIGNDRFISCYHEEGYHSGSDTYGMDVRLSELVGQGLNFEYVYDFGDSSYLDLSVMEYMGQVPLDRAIYIPARNNPVYKDRPNSPRVGMCGYVGDEDFEYDKLDVDDYGVTDYFTQDDIYDDGADIEPVADLEAEYYEEKERIARLQAEYDKAVEERDEFIRSINDTQLCIYKPISSTNMMDILRRFTMEGLVALGNQYGIKRINNKKKGDIISLLVNKIPSLVLSNLRLLSPSQLRGLRRLLDGQGLKPFSQVFNEVYEYSKGLIAAYLMGVFITVEFVDGKEVAFCAIPDSIRKSLNDYDWKDIKKLGQRNNRWINLTMGMLYYYGVMDVETAATEIERVTGQEVDRKELGYVLDIEARWNDSFNKNKSSLVHIMVEDPELLLKKAKSEVKKNKDLQYRKLTKTEMLQAKSVCYTENTQAFNRLKKYILANYKVGVYEAEEDIIDLLGDFDKAMDTEAIQSAANEFMDKYDISYKEHADNMAKHVTDVFNSQRKWWLLGNSPAGLKENVSETEGKEENAASKAGETRSKKKIGRNEPCPCGSGKKYKKCCGR